MSLDSVQQTVPTALPRGCIYEEMQREDFLALAAALRRFNACQAPVAQAAPARRIVTEPRLTLALE